MAISHLQKQHVPGGRRQRAVFANAPAWIQRHWLDLLLPPAAFLLAAGVYQQLYWTRQGMRSASAARHYQAAVQAAKKGNSPAALKELLAASDVAPDDPAFHLRLGRDLQAQDQKIRAARHIERGVLLQPPNESASMDVLRAYVDASMYEDAERVLRQEVLPRWPHSAEAAYYEGLIALYRGKGREGLQQAACSLDRCLRLDPRHVDARYEYAFCLSRLGRPAEAERAFRQVLKVAPFHSGAHLQLAAVLRQQGKTAAARQVLEAFRRRDEGERRIRYLETQRELKRISAAGLLELADLYGASDQPAGAEAALREYQLQRPTAPRSYRKLAQLYCRFHQREMGASLEKLAAVLEAKARGGR